MQPGYDGEYGIPIFDKSNIRPTKDIDDFKPFKPVKKVQKNLGDFG